MRLRRRIICIGFTLLTLLTDTSVLPYTGLDMRFVPRVCLVFVILVGTILGSTQGMIYGAMAGILLGITAYQPPGLIAAMYTLCAFSAGFISRRIRPALVTVLPPAGGYMMYEASMLIYRYFSTGYLPVGNLVYMLIRLVIALALVQLMYIPGIRLLKPSSIGKARR